MKGTKKLVVVLLVCCWNIAIGQDARTDLLQLYRNFEGVENIYMELESRAMKGQEIGMEQNGKLYKRKGDYYYSTGQYTLLVNQHYMIVVDNQNKTIICRSWNEEKATQLKQQKIPSVDDILKRYPKVTYKGLEGTYKHYSLENDQEMVHRVDVFLDQKTGFTKKTIYYYHPKSAAAGAEVQITVPVIKINPTFSSQRFSEQQFIRTDHGKLKPAVSYGEYRLHDLREKAIK